MSLQTSLGQVLISDQVISKITGRIVAVTDGVVLNSSGVIENIVKHFSRSKVNQKGIQIVRSDADLSIEVKVSVRYGIKIPRITIKYP